MTTGQSQVTAPSAQGGVYDAAALLFLYTETPLHAGTGANLGTVDLPIQREVTTQYPMIQGSSVKGALRSLARRTWGKPNPQKPEELQASPNEVAIFGPEGENASAHAGALIVADARILLFPVRSLEDTFMYVTSAEVLARFSRDYTHVKGASALKLARSDTSAPDQGQAWVTQEGMKKRTATTNGEKKLTLEEFTFTPIESPGLAGFAAALARLLFPSDSGDTYSYWREKLTRSLVVLPDTDFRDFVVYATQIDTRIKLNYTTKTVDAENGALWTEESLPSDTVLYVPVFATQTRKAGTSLSGNDVIATVRGLTQSASGSYLQLGGDETVGRGVTHVTWSA